MSQGTVMELPDLGIKQSRHEFGCLMDDEYGSRTLPHANGLEVDQTLHSTTEPENSWIGEEDFVDFEHFFSSHWDLNSDTEINESGIDEQLSRRDHGIAAIEDCLINRKGDQHSTSFQLLPHETPDVEEDNREDVESDSREEPSDEDSSELGKWCLRPQSRELVFIPSTWLDTDKSGNYDPIAEQRQLRVKHRRARAAAKRRCPFESDEDPEIPMRRPRLELPSLLLQMRFRDAGKINTFAQLIQRWLKESEQQSHIDEGYKLRNRDATARKLEDPTDSSRARKVDLHEALTGWPIARGCEDCAELGQRCSLLDDERTWPCLTCKDDDLDCALIHPPTRKLSCSSCKSKRQPCSYAFTRNHAKPCLNCTEHGLPCIAGPAKDAIRIRIRYDRNWTLDPLPKSKARKGKTDDACRECRTAGQPCTLERDSDTYGPCRACASGDLPCTVDQAHERSAQVEAEAPCKAKVRNKTVRDDPISVPKFIPPSTLVIPEKKSQLKAVSGSKPVAFPAGRVQPSGKVVRAAPRRTWTIRTNFYHPVEFNYINTTRGQNRCHLCAEPLLALFGLVKREVEVAATADGKAYIELKGGLRAAGRPSTRVCMECTILRLPILVCARHDMQRIPGRSATPSHQHQPLAALVQGHKGVDMKMFCSLCPGLAGYECATRPAGAGEEIRGCGLRVCEACQPVLVGRHRGVLSEMLAQVSDAPHAQWPLGFRADLEFLRADGPLARFLRGLGRG